MKKTKIVKISLITLISWLLACLFLINIVQAATDPKEEAFTKQCLQELKGDYIAKESVPLDSNPCRDGGEKLEATAFGLQNLFCCRNKPTTEITPDLSTTGMVKDLQKKDLAAINPLKGTVLGKATPADVINRALFKVVFPLAGSLLFILLVLGGFEVLTASLSGKQNYIAMGKARVTNAIIGFIILFSTYWLWRALMIIFKIH